MKYDRKCQAPPRPPLRYIPIDRKQLRLEPLDVERLIDDDHPARKIWRLVEQLDLSAFEADVRAVEGDWMRASLAIRAGAARFAASGF